MSALEDARAALAEDRDYVVSNRERLLEEILEALIAELERLTTPPTDDEREALAGLLDEQFGNWQWDSVAPGMSAGRYVAPMVLAAGFRRQGPITDAQLLAALNAYDPRFATEDLDDYAAEHQADMRAAVEAAINYKKEES